MSRAPRRAAPLRFLAAPPERRRAFLTALWRMAEARAIHAARPASRLVPGLRRSAERSQGFAGAAGPGTPPELMFWGLARAARLLPLRGDCLVQAIAADRWLNRERRPHRFHLGAASAERSGGAGPVLAHAWITVDGVVASGGELSPELTEFAPSSPPPDPAADSGA